MSEWQPIETAPKDGTHVLLYLSAMRDTPIVVGYYRSVLKVGDTFDGWRVALVPDDRTSTDGWRTWDGREVPERYSPTHWMPLPKPPGTERD